MGAGLQPLAETPIAVGFSGGLDSTVLLAALRQLGLRRLRAIHVHHGLQPAADAWVDHAEAVCAGWGLALEVRRVAVDAGSAQGPEAAAREARYAAFAASLAAGEVLALAHHRDDQAETFLLRALRGSGPRGLAAMRSWRPHAAGAIWRPLLDTPRADLAGWARSQGLRWVEDPHNHDARYERVWLRQQLLPKLAAHGPAALERLAESARLCAEADALLDELAAADAARARAGDSLDLGVLAALSPARQRLLLRWWVRERGLPPPPRTRLDRLPELLDAAGDAEPLLDWPGAELRRYRGRLYLMTTLPAPPPPDFCEDWDGRGALCLPPGCGRLSGAEPVRRRFSVRFAAGGERYRPHPEQPSRRLKNLFQESAVPPWRRRRTPLLFEEERLVWIGGLKPALPAPAVEWHPL